MRCSGSLRLCIAVLGILVCVSPVYAAGEVVSIFYCHQRMTHHHALASVKEAYRRANIAVTFVALPCKRSLAAANSGKVGGELARIAKATEIYSNLVRASSPSITIEGVIITKSITRDISSWQDLKGLRIGIVRGEIYAEKGTEGMPRQLVNSYHQLLSKIDTGEFEVGVAVRRNWLLEKQHPRFRDSTLHQLGKPVFSAPLYHLLHKRHADLMPRLNKVFKQMWQSGEAQRIHKGIEAMLFSQ